MNCSSPWTYKSLSLCVNTNELTITERKKKKKKTELVPVIFGSSKSKWKVPTLSASPHCSEAAISAVLHSPNPSFSQVGL